MHNCFHFSQNGSQKVHGPKKHQIGYSKLLQPRSITDLPSILTFYLLCEQKILSDINTNQDWKMFFVKNKLTLCISIFFLNLSRIFPKILQFYQSIYHLDFIVIIIIASWIKKLPQCQLIYAESKQKVYLQTIYSG